jgi:hypothetical protein
VAFLEINSRSALAAFAFSLFSCGGAVADTSDSGSLGDPGHEGSGTDASRDTGPLPADAQEDDACSTPTDAGVCIRCGGDTWRCGVDVVPQCPSDAHASDSCSIPDGSESFCISCGSNGQGFVLYCMFSCGYQSGTCWSGVPTSCAE